MHRKMVKSDLISSGHIRPGPDMAAGYENLAGFRPGPDMIFDATLVMNNSNNHDSTNIIWRVKFYLYFVCRNCNENRCWNYHRCVLQHWTLWAVCLIITCVCCEIVRLSLTDQQISWMLPVTTTVVFCVHALLKCQAHGHRMTSQYLVR